MRLELEYNENLKRIKGREMAHLIVLVDDGVMDEAQAYMPVLDRFITVTALVRDNPYILKTIQNDIDSIDWDEKEDSE